ncbi:MAG: hypothetical protein ACO3PD_06290 [Acidimicrobiales bacterium]
MELRWEDRQRAFQALVVAEHDVTLTVRPYRTFVGAATGQPPPAGSRLERALLVVIAGTVISGVLVLFAPRPIVALVAGLAGGIAVFAGLAGPDPRMNPEPLEPLLAIYAPQAGIGAAPECVTAIAADEVDRLGPEGFGTVIGTVRPGGTVGMFVDEYIVWARTPPRGSRKGDPAFGEL